MARRSKRFLPGFVSVAGSQSWECQLDLYRAYVFDDDGYILGFDKMICRDDAEALQKVSHLLDDQEVEVWTGPRPVTVLCPERNRDVL